MNRESLLQIRALLWSSRQWIGSGRFVPLLTVLDYSTYKRWPKNVRRTSKNALRGPSIDDDRRKYDFSEGVAIAGRLEGDFESSESDFVQRKRLNLL